jgi:hypothetical protein
MEAELVALESATTEAEWLKELLMGLPMVDKLVPAIMLHCDNRSMIIIVGNAKEMQSSQDYVKQRIKSVRHFRNTGEIVIKYISTCRRFDPEGSLDRRVNCRCVSQPRWVGARRNTRGKQQGKPRLVLSCAQGGCACSRGLQAFARERESLLVSPSSRAATFPYEGPGPSFYRRKERAQVYNGGCSSVLTCSAERSQSPMYMPTWLSERCWCPIHVMSWPSEERLNPVEA